MLKFSELSKELNNHFANKRNELTAEEEEKEKNNRIQSIVRDLKSAFDEDDSSPVVSESDYSNLSSPQNELPSPQNELPSPPDEPEPINASTPENLQQEALKITNEFRTDKNQQPAEPKKSNEQEKALFC